LNFEIQAMPNSRHAGQPMKHAKVTITLLPDDLRQIIAAHFGVPIGPLRVRFDVQDLSSDRSTTPEFGLRAAEVDFVDVETTIKHSPPGQAHAGDFPGS
jgi:hypothetical protein